MKLIISILVFICLTSCATTMHGIGRYIASSAPDLSCDDLINAFIPKKGYGLGDIVSENYVDYDNELHVTQFLYGRPGVLNRKLEIDALSFDELQTYLDEKPIPFVRGPDGLKYIIDRHHFSRALYEIRPHLVDKFGDLALDLKISFQEVKIWNVNTTELTPSEFGDVMIDQNLTYLRKGKKMRQFNELPKEIHELKDDYYRGLAWLLRKAGAFEKTDVPFAEFYWGDYLKKKLKIQNKVITKRVIRKAIKAAINQNHKSRELPGFIDRGSLSKDEEERIVKNYVRKLKKKGLLDLVELEEDGAAIPFEE